jgi:5'-nucleotidase
VKNRLTQKLLGEAEEFVTKELNNKKIGFFGLAEQEWLELTHVDEEILEYEDFVICAKRLVKKLKEELKCDYIFALTHMRVPNDELLAQEVPEIDIIFGGHDHFVY